MQGEQIMKIDVDSGPSADWVPYATHRFAWDISVVDDNPLRFRLENTRGRATQTTPRLEHETFSSCNRILAEYY